MQASVALQPLAIPGKNEAAPPAGKGLADAGEMFIIGVLLFCLHQIMFFLCRPKTAWQHKPR